MRFVSKPPLTKIIGCRSLLYHYYAFGRTESRDICQNASFVTIIMPCAISILWSSCKLIGSPEICQQASVDHKIGCSCLLYRRYAVRRTGRREICRIAFLCLYNYVLRAIHITICIKFDWKPWDFFSRPPLTKIIGCSSFIYRWYAFGRTESHKFSQNAFLCLLICIW